MNGMVGPGVSRRLIAAQSVMLAALAGGCAGVSPLPVLPTQGVTGSLAAAVAGGVEASHQPHRSAEIYSRIARGANACWFGPRGRFSATHILHADAAPSMSGGRVEIIVHERALDQPTPWGPRALRIELSEAPGLEGTPGGGGTGIVVDNTRFPDPEATRMRAEVLQWAAGTDGCKAEPSLDRPPEVAAPLRPQPTPPGSKAARK